jgi:predicted esterase
MQAHEDEEGIATSREYIQRLITDQIDMGVPPDRIVLGGFSQGAAMFMLSGLTFDKKLAGIVVLSGWMLLSADIKNLVRPENKQTPVFMGHRDNDPAVKQALTKMSFGTLKEMGYNGKMQTYEYVTIARG